MELKSDLNLQYIERLPLEEKNTQLLILAHGYGSNEKDLMGFARYLPKNFLILSLRAPSTLHENGFSWYDISFFGGEKKVSVDEAKDSSKKIAEFVLNAQTKYKIEASKTWYLGFSQGAIMSFYLMINHPKIIRRYLALSGYHDISIAPFIKNEGQNELSIFVSHGLEDEVIPFDWSNDSITELKQNFPQIEYYSFSDMGHGVSPENFSAILTFMNKHNG